VCRDRYKTRGVFLVGARVCVCVCVCRVRVCVCVCVTNIVFTIKVLARDLTK
jgi:hypothetical protein